MRLLKFSLMLSLIPSFTRSLRVTSLQLSRLLLRPSLRFSLALVLIGQLSACGQTGPLYMPAPLPPLPNPPSSLPPSTPPHLSTESFVPESSKDSAPQSSKSSASPSIQAPQNNSAP